MRRSTTAVFLLALSIYPGCASPQKLRRIAEEQKQADADAEKIHKNVIEDRAVLVAKVKSLATTYSTGPDSAETIATAILTDCRDEISRLSKTMADYQAADPHEPLTSDQMEKLFHEKTREFVRNTAIETVVSTRADRTKSR